MTADERDRREAQEYVDSTVRRLAIGDRIAARPCVVTITSLSLLGAEGWCSTCGDRHVIDRRRYDNGLGPWQPKNGRERGR